MTKVEMQFELTGPLNGTLFRRISDAHRIYGLQKLQLSESMDRLLVEYDASRLKPAQVEDTLHRAGIPARRAG